MDDKKIIRMDSLSPVAFDQLLEQMKGWVAQALHDAVKSRQGLLNGTGHTVTNLVADIEDPLFRAKVKDILLFLKIDAVIEGLGKEWNRATSEEIDEMRAFLLALQEQMLKAPMPELPSASE